MLAQMSSSQNDILHNLLDSFITTMAPIIDLQKTDKFNHWPNFHQLLKEKPLNYYNIQQFLGLLDTDSKSQTQQQLHEVNSSKSIENQKYYLKKDLSSKRSNRNTTYSKITSLSPRLQFATNFEEFIKNYIQKQNYPLSYYSTFNMDQLVFITVDQNLDDQQPELNSTECLFKLITFEYFHSLLREDPTQFQEMLLNITSKQVKLLLPILTQTTLMMTEEHFYQSLIESCQVILRESDQPKQIIQPIEFFRQFQTDSQFCDCMIFIIKDIVYKFALQQFTSGTNNSFVDQQDLQQLLDYFTENQKIQITLNHLEIISCALQRRFEINELNSQTGKIEVQQFPARNKQAFFSINKTHQRSLSVFGNSSSRETNKLQIAFLIVTENAENNKNIIDIAIAIQKTEFAVIAQSEEINQINYKSNGHSKFRSYEKSKTQMFNQANQEKLASKTLLSTKHNQQQPKDASKRLLTEENSFNETSYQQYQQMQSQRESKSRESLSSRNNLNLQKSQNYMGQKAEQIMPQIVVKKTLEVTDILTQNTEKLNQLLTPKTIPLSQQKNQLTPKPISQQQQTYFQNYQQPPTYQVYNSRPSSQYQQAQVYPASVYPQPQSMHFQQQSCHSQQHSFQYFSTQQQQQTFQQQQQQQQLEKGIAKNQPVASNGFISNNLFY